MENATFPDVPLATNGRRQERFIRQKIESVRRVVSSKNYTSHYDKNHKGIMGLKKFDYEYEVFKLNKLITDPRQYHYFKSEYFTYPPPRDNKKIPQEIINKYVPKPSEKR